MKAIPTFYRDTNFRSRLEARWARFFDLVEWSWDYEPIDMNGWIPDFVIKGKNKRTFVEVKPIYALTPELIDRYELPDFDQEILLLGCGPQGINSWPTLGWLGEREDGRIWNEAIAGFRNVDGKKVLDFASCSFSFRGRITGIYDGSHGFAVENVFDVLTSLWRRAGQAVQWMPRAQMRNEPPVQRGSEQRNEQYCGPCLRRTRFDLCEKSDCPMR